MNELSNKQIDDIIHEQHLKYNGCYSKDALPLPLTYGFYVVNMQSSYAGNGTHWCVLYINDRENACWWDPFGFPAPLEVEKLLKKYYYNDKDIQDINATSCGFFSIAFIKYMTGRKDVKKSFNDFVKLFSKNPKNNDKILKYIFKL